MRLQLQQKHSNHQRLAHTKRTFRWAKIKNLRKNSWPAIDEVPSNEFDLSLFLLVTWWITLIRTLLVLENFWTFFFIYTWLDIVSNDLKRETREFLFHAQSQTRRRNNRIWNINSQQKGMNGMFGLNFLR